MKKKVIIIGAGPSGLAALKEMREAGHEAVVFEKADSYGGVFRQHNKDTYDNLYLTISNLFMAFSDFPPLEKCMRYITKEEYNAYLGAYIEHFDLSPHMHFNHEVIHAKLNDDEQWEVQINNASGEITVNNADHLVVATGSHTLPNMIPLNGYSGERYHAAQYKNNKGFENKRVLVVGIGESACDIASEISEVAQQTVVWSRRPFLMAPRFPRRAWVQKGYDEQHIISKALDLVLDLNYWRTDQSMVVTKNSRLTGLAAQNKLDVIMAKSIQFSGLATEFHDVIFNEMNTTNFTFDTVVACTGYKTKFDWLKADIDPNPRTWYKHCFPPN